jgi:mandelate racemase
MTKVNARIVNVRVRTVRVPLPVPHTTASGTVSESPLVLTDIECDDGSRGRSIVFTYTAAALKPVADLVAAFGGWITGETAAPLEVEQKLARRLRLLGPQGLTGMAAAAIDMALWDAAARRSQLSLAGLLGGTAPLLDAYGAVGYDGVDESARTAEQWARRGFKAVKAKIGYPTVATDVAVIRAMRAATGPDVAIMVDYNQCLTPTEAIQRMKVLDEEGLAWVEEPTLAHDYEGHAQVARAARTPIQCGENWWGALDLRHAVQAQASDLLMLDVMKIGGVSGWLRGAALGHAHNLRISSHLWPEISAQLLAVTSTAHWLEYADWWNAVLAEPLVVRDGRADFGGVIGSGIDWNETAIARLAA